MTDSQVSFAKKEYERFEKIKTLNSLYMLDDYIVSQCLEYVYYSAPPFPYVPESYSIIISGSNLILQDNNREYCRISNWKDSIEDAIKKL